MLLNKKLKKTSFVAEVKAEDPTKDFIELFREQATKYPNQVIVVTQQDRITYEELDKKSDKLAGYLVQAGIKANNLVGLCSSVSADFIIAMLGILKAGAVYFPLDPEYPKERREHMLRDANPSLVLAEEHLTDLIKDIKVIAIKQAIFEGEYKLKSCSTDSVGDLENLAYVVYTSGSTGMPKGIMITRRSLSNVALAHKAYYPPNMRMLLSGGVCFDASLLVVFHALANNAPLYLFNHHMANGADDLVRFLQENAIDFMISVPSNYLKLLQTNLSLPFLKCVSLTGENLPQHLCHLHANLAPNAILYNEYGPTEYAIGTTIAKIYNPQNQSVSQITVGQPLPNTQVYILSSDLEPLPSMSKGEICISGIGLAKGYINREKLTSEKFVNIKIPGQGQLRLYRTGDAGRFLPSGELEFLGRLDQNIKICGEWIHIGEIEHYISRRPDVQEAAVLVQKTIQGGKELVAYITSVKKTAKTSLLRYLKTLLPQPIPCSVIRIDKFPLSPNGKIDRHCLLHVHERT